MIIEKVIFISIVAMLQGTILYLSFRKSPAIYTTLFFLCLLCEMAFYLFAFGNLAQFTIEGFSAKAQLVQNKTAQVIQDSDQVEQLKQQSRENAEQIKQVLAGVTNTRKDLEKAQTEFRERTKSLDVTIDEVAKNVRDRTITAEQKKQFLAYVAQYPKGKVQIIYRNNDHEAYSYANDIESLLKDAGFTITKKQFDIGISQTDEKGASPFAGIGIGIKDSNNPPVGAGVIQNGFRAIEINAPGEPFKGKDDLPADVSVVIVGEKPH